MSLLDFFSEHLGVAAPAEEKKAPFSAVDYINKNLGYEEKVYPSAPNSIFRTSFAIDICPWRETYYAKNQKVRIKTVDARLARIFDIGTSFHEIVQQKWFKNILFGDWECINCKASWSECQLPSHDSCHSSDLRYKEIKISDPKLGMSGHVDGIVVHGGDKLVLELKTCNSRQFQLIRGKGKPLEKHVKQINNYMGLLGLKSGLVLYLDKDESMMVEFLVRFDQSLFDLICGRVQNTLRAIGGFEEPEKICLARTDSEAKKCPCVSVCFKRGA